MMSCYNFLVMGCNHVPSYLQLVVAFTLIRRTIGCQYFAPNEEHFIRY
jgi:hypothetical protein